MRGKSETSLNELVDQSQRSLKNKLTQGVSPYVPKELAKRPCLNKLLFLLRVN